MIRLTLAATIAGALLLPQAAEAKKFREKDRSTNNTCAYVHKWFLMTNSKHAVFVTGGGVSFASAVANGNSCHAGGAATLAAATSYAMGRCKSLNKQAGDRRRCKVVESR